MPASYRRFVALGDSQTEGLNDRDEHGTLVGWADRLAQALASTTSPGLRYANLAVRGARAAHVHNQQLPAALALEPDLATVAVGMNDVLRHDFDLDRTLDHIEQTIVALGAAGARVATMTFPDIGAMVPVLRSLRPREVDLNAGIKALAERHGADLLDLFPLRMCADPRMWSADRIHGSSFGHRRIAAGMAALLEVPCADGSWAQPDLTTVGLPVRFARLRATTRDVQWVATVAVPFLARQLLRGTTRAAKRPSLVPLVVGTGEGRPTLSGEAALAD